MEKAGLIRNEFHDVVRLLTAVDLCEEVEVFRESMFEEKGERRPSGEIETFELLRHQGTDLPLLRLDIMNIVWHRSLCVV